MVLGLYLWHASSYKNGGPDNRFPHEPPMRKASPYIRAVEWIAMNDEPTKMDLAVVAEQISVLLVADVFGKGVEEVAGDIIHWREGN